MPRRISAVAMFVRLLARYAGDLTLLFKATGGVYITGGVARRIAPLLDVAAFRAAFEAHPPYENFSRRVADDADYLRSARAARLRGRRDREFTSTA